MVAPEGWEIVELDEVAIIGDGLHGTPEYDKNGRYFFINGNNLQNGRIVVDINTKRVNFNVYEKLDNHFSLDTIFMSINGTIGNMAYFNNEMVVIGKSIAYFNSSKRISKNYLFFYLQNNQLLEYFCEALTGSTIKNLGLNVIRKAKILLPPLPEQLRIAEVLSDTDLYITTLEQLIAKKEAVKQGTMQELLTGKRRLPGFKGEWVEKRLGEIGYTYSGLSGKQKHDFGVGNAQYITFLNVLSNTVIDTSILERVTISTSEKQNVVQCGDIFFNTSSETPEEVGMCAVLTIPLSNTYLNSFCFGFRLISDEINALFLSYYFNSGEGRKIMLLLAQGATRYNLTKTYLMKAVLTLPLKNEQTAIAEILSDMDAELSALKKKLEKIRLIKQGMMDALLTGKIRLPEDKPNVQFTQRKEQEEIPYAAEKTEEYTAEAKKAKHHANSEGYQDAVILAALVHRFGTKNFPFTAFDCQKFPYLFYRYMEGQTKGYRKFAAGPYNPALKYKTARPIALKKKYIQDHIGKYRGFISGINVQEALNYFQQWYGNEPLAWFEQFRYIPKRKDELELLTTTDMSMVEIRGEGRNITVQSVKELMKKNPEWKDKLNRPIFSDNNIERAIKWCYDLFGELYD